MDQDVEITRFMAQTRSLQKTCRALPQLAEKAGKKGTITVIIVKIE